jgi:hypothetical protein
VRRADNLTIFMCRLSRNLGASTSWNPQGLFRPVMELLYLYYVNVVSFTPRPPYHPRQRARYSLNKRHGSALSRSGRFGIKKNFLPLPEIEPWFCGRQPEACTVAIPTEPPRLQFNVARRTYRTGTSDKWNSFTLSSQSTVQQPVCTPRNSPFTINNKTLLEELTVVQLVTTFLPLKEQACLL